MTTRCHSRVIDAKGFEPLRRPAHSPSSLSVPTSITRPALAALLLCLAACNDYSGPYRYPPPNQPSFPNGTIQQPTTINLYPSRDGNRLYVMVTAVGSQTVSMPLAFDTGSAGITLYAPAMSLPPTIFNSNGFIFAEGQNTIVYNGITITNQVATRTYGGSGGKTETGNIGFAQVTFGDSQGALTTDTITVFLYYLVTENAAPHAVTSEEQQGWFGVNTEANLITVINPRDGATANLPCSTDTATSCYVVSVLKHLQYAPWLNGGFALTPHALQPSCNIFEAASCLPAPMLTVGLTNNIESNFSTVSLTCPQPDYSGPTVIDGYFVCADLIPFSTITLAVPGVATPVTLNQSVLFDSGNPAIDIDYSGSNLLSPLPRNTAVSISTPSGFTYSYIAGASGDVTETFINTGINTGFGINFFTEHSFFIDFATNTEGWM